MRDTSRKARLVMEERNVDLQEVIRLQRVRRRLFRDDNDDNDHSEVSNGRINNGENDNLVNRLFEQARQNQEDAKQKWNFDFVNEVPLPGRYEWVKLDRDGNEISDFVQSNNGVQNPREERPETVGRDRQEPDKTENDDKGDRECTIREKENSNE